MGERLPSPFYHKLLLGDGGLVAFLQDKNILMAHHFCIIGIKPLMPTFKTSNLFMQTRLKLYKKLYGITMYGICYTMVIP